jgi:hypothetical protein
MPIIRRASDNHHRMTPFRRHLLLYWLLPVLLVRALIPVGFMLEWRDGHASVVVCTGIVQSEHQHEHAGQPSAQSSLTVCPFAESLGTPSLAFALPQWVAPPQPGVFAELAPSLVELPFGPIRTQQSRAPPALA